MPLKHLLFGLLAVALVVSLVTDLGWRRILDLVTLPAAVLALGLRTWFEGVGDLEHGLVSGAVGLAACLLVFGAFARFRQAFGWGDVKLLCAVGAGFGYPLVLAALMFVSLAGALQAIVTLIWQGAVSDTLRQAFGRGQDSTGGGGAARTMRTIPYGVAIALGSAWTMWWAGVATGT